CPLTGVPSGSSGVPNRPIYAVKVPNDTEQARGHQTGLDSADIVYEEPVEGGITRFIALFQCQNASRIEPVRSARFVDLDVLGQFGKVLFGHAGGINPVLAAVSTEVKAGEIVDANYSGTPYANDYHRDGSLAEPDNLYTSTAEIYKTAGTSAGGAPSPLFTFLTSSSATVTAEAGAGPGSTVQVPFDQPGSAYNPTWTWNAATGTYLRSYNGTADKLTDGQQNSAANVVIMSVNVYPSQYTEDATGAKENLVTTTGQGTAWVCRDDSCVKGSWSRANTTSPIQYTDSSGATIAFQPGETWVELQPMTESPKFS
ncbi:MAG: DUF3048 domain-containing protein, partial [Actinomycetota bacterium]